MQQTQDKVSSKVSHRHLKNIDKLFKAVSIWRNISLKTDVLEMTMVNIHVFYPCSVLTGFQGRIFWKDKTTNTFILLAPTGSLFFIAIQYQTPKVTLKGHAKLLNPVSRIGQENVSFRRDHTFKKIRLDLQTSIIMV